MRLALVSNWQIQACGVANFGRDWAAALRRAKYEVIERYWDQVPSRRADLTLFNWHPFTAGPPLGAWPVPYAVYLHDIPPHSTCGLVERAVAVWAAEPCPGAKTIPYPVYDGPWERPEVPTQVTLGWSGLRGDGLDALREVCERRSWTLNASDGWRDTPQEVERLAASTLIVLWYFASGRGQSLALSTAIATRRPVLVNDSRMFRLAEAGGVMRVGRDITPPHLEQAIEAALDQVWKGTAPIPYRTAEVWSWAQSVRRMEAAWTT